MADVFVISADEYRILVEQAPIMIWRSNTTMACDYFNERWLSFTGRTMEQEMGNGWAEGVHPEDFDRCLNIYTSSFKARKIFEMEYRLKRKDGQYRWLFDRGVPFKNAKGKFAGYIGSCIDIADQVKARDVLAKQKEKEIEQLRHLLPICAVCRKIRDDKGYWKSLERYFEDVSDQQFTHGICPECLKHYDR